MFTRKDLDDLVGADICPAVSIYMFTHPAGREIREDPIRLDNLLQQAEERLRLLGHPRSAVEEWAAPVRGMIGDNRFWRLQEEGLAIFYGPGFFRCHKLPLRVEEEVFVGPRFQITPLLPLLSGGGRFLLVAVSAARARLFEGSKWALAEVPDANLPQGVATIAEESQYEQTVHAQPQARPQGRMAAEVPSAQNLGESPEELRKAMLIEYLRRVGAALEKRLPGVREPVLLAAQPEVAGNFRKMSRLGTLLAETLDCNPDALDEKELHRRAWAVVERQLPDEADEAVERLAALTGDGSNRATIKPSEIVKGARWGRVDTLVLAHGEHLWGRFDETGDDIVAAHRVPRMDDEDLLNYAAILTLRQGGAVRPVPREDMPAGAVAGAIMRYGFDRNRPFEKSPS